MREPSFSRQPARSPSALRSYKLGAPHIGDHVRRPALLDRLKRAHRRVPAVWVVGLPGSGKTSLVARFLKESKTPAIWYRLGAEDSDGVSWINALVETLSNKGPTFSPENQVELFDFVRNFFAQLPRRPLTLVLDDCHRVADEAGLFEILDLLREVGPPKLKVVLISRREPRPSLLRGVTGGWLEIIDDLRLTPAEVAELLGTAAAGKPKPEDARRIAIADGWLAYVLALSRKPSSALRLTDDPTTRVGDFLAAELLASVPAHHRPELRRLAELPAIPAEPRGHRLAPEVSRLLRTLSAQRYFVDLNDGRYRLHDLLRDALLRFNAAEDPPEVLRQVRRELAGWIALTLPEGAMQLRVAAADTPGALTLLEEHGAAWLARGLHRTLDAWVRALPPPDSGRLQAQLALWRALALLPLEPETARPQFADARRIAIDAGEATVAYAAWCGEVDSYVIQWGAVQGLADLVDVLETMETRLGAPPDTLRFRVSATALTALMYGRAEDPRIVRFADATARAVTHAPDAGARISAAAQLLIYRMWWAGDFPGGRALYDTFDTEVAQGDGLDPLPRLLWWSCAAIVDWQCGSPDECYRKVDRGLALGVASGVHVRDFFLLTQGIFCALSQEDWQRAETYLTQLARTERHHRRLDVMVHHFFRSWYSLSRGDPHTARSHAESAWQLADEMGSMFHKVIALSALGPSLVHCGELEGAEFAYRSQLALAKSANNHTFTFIAFCAGAEIALASGDDAAVAKQIERMLRVKQLGGFHSTCGWRTPMMRRLLSFALRHDILAETARTWIRERKMTPPDEPVPGWPLPVFIETANGLEVRFENGFDAKPAAGGKSARKLRELLAVLAVARNGSTQAELVEWLWPDSDGDRAAASLKIAVHRLRRWLGADAVRVADGRIRLNPGIVDCDLWRAAPHRGLEPERVLHGFDLPPVRALREALRSA